MTFASRVKNQNPSSSCQSDLNAKGDERVRAISRPISDSASLPVIAATGN